MRRRSSGVRSVPRILAIVALLLGLAGCATNPEVTSNKAPDYRALPKRLLVVQSLSQFPIPMPPTPHETAFRQALDEDLSRCGIEGEFVARSGASINGAEGTLSITWLSSVTGTVSGSRIEMATYMAELVDSSSKRSVWKARMIQRPEPGGPPKMGASLAHSLVAQLSKDGIFRSCPAGRS